MNTELHGDVGGNPTMAAFKLRSVVSFGLGSRVFYAAIMLNLESPNDIPDASKLRTLAGVFKRTSQFIASAGGWGSSRLTDMSRMFLCAVARMTRFQPSAYWRLGNF